VDVGTSSGTGSQTPAGTLNAARGGSYIHP